MMKSLLVILFLFNLLFSSCTKNAKQGNWLSETQLQTVDHKDFSFQELTTNKGSVILFLQPECPFCNSYGKTLKQLDSVFTILQVKIYAVVAGKNFSDSEIVDYK